MPLIPFKKDQELSTSYRKTPQNARSATADHLKGQPRIEVDGDNLATYVSKDLLTPRLDDFGPYLWLLAKQDSSHISSLTHQIVKGRSIVLTEDPELHLVWINDRVFIKPVPKYLLSYDFWKNVLLDDTSKLSKAARDKIIRSATGFLRSYSLLIKHKSDFRVAQGQDDPRSRLLPKKIGYEAFSLFMSTFADVRDDEVSERWRFGELRLTRLNMWTRILFRGFAFHKVHPQYSDLLANFYGPFAFVFAFLSVALSAMQVMLGVEAFKPSYSSDAFTRTAWDFSIFSLISIGFLVFSLLAILAALMLRETVFALNDKFSRARKVKHNTVV